MKASATHYAKFSKHKFCCHTLSDEGFSNRLKIDDSEITTIYMVHSN